MIDQFSPNGLEARLNGPAGPQHHAALRKALQDLCAALETRMRSGGSREEFTRLSAARQAVAGALAALEPDPRRSY